MGGGKKLGGNRRTRYLATAKASPIGSNRKRQEMFGWLLGNRSYHTLTLPTFHKTSSPARSYVDFLIIINT